ncbi:MAG TPA: alpha/beta hydrolase-fold protein [Nocardioides sp.]|uniref:alpha/beta hydrolase n=1 Tax=Nocardioides sp. TaxID=35761 RepID=UPI002E306994|nr:alpha/beta hydrolase-fold protein [Nocardioides sp.]HEX3931956.1 alpha/beta hydrolase-fold protein [Nocardioides sp.]
MLVTEVDGNDVVVRYDDPGHAATHVGVWAHLRLGDVSMSRVEGGWQVRLTDLPVDRLEYLLDIDGTLRPDPSNPRVAGGPFGDHSWIALPGYREPAWLDIEPSPGRRATLTLSRTGAGRIDTELWTPADAPADRPLPLLVSHDGPEMDRYGGLTAYVGAMIATRTLPPVRVALVSPGPRRNQRYAANPRYARAFATRLVPALADAVPLSHPPVLMGQSLGALAALHAVWTSPHLFSGAFLQSGSFFTASLDPQESGFEHWREVTGFVASVRAAEQAPPDAPPTTLVCGTAEENHANNLAIRDHLAAIGIETGWGEVRDGHTWTCWRDTLDPHLTALLLRVWA